MTDDEAATLRALHGDVHDAQECVSEAAGRRNAYMRLLLQQGETDRTIANVLKLTRQRVNKILNHKK